MNWLVCGSPEEHIIGYESYKIRMFQVCAIVSCGPGRQNENKSSQARKIVSVCLIEQNVMLIGEEF
jgi:hypothetical protein